jgi:hypothetical protein
VLLLAVWFQRRDYKFDEENTIGHMVLDTLWGGMALNWLLQNSLFTVA